MTDSRQLSWKSKIEKWLPLLLWLLIILVRIPFLDRGIDYTDTGYNIEKYKNVFFGNGISDIGMFYTDLIGGLIYKLLPAYHLLVYRILHWLMNLATTFFAYQIFKQHVNKNVLLLFYLAAATLIGGEMIFSYYPLSQVLLLASVLLLHNGLLANRKWEIFASGLVAGLSVFARLTNLFYLSMFLCILWYGYRIKQEKKIIWRNVLFYIFGAISAFAVTLILMTAFMGIDQVVASFMRYVEVALGLSGSEVVNFLGIEEVSGHSLVAEIKMIGYQGIQSIALFLIFFIPMLLIGQLLKTFAYKKGKDLPILRYMNILTVIIWCVGAVLFANRLANIVLYILGLASIVLSIAFMIVGSKKQPFYSTLCLMNILLSIFSVIGTDKGLQRFFIVRTIQIAVLLICALNLPAYWDDLLKRCRLSKLGNKVTAQVASNWMKGLSVLLCITIFATGFFSSMPTVYCDATPKEMTYRFGDEIPQLKGMRTSQIRAEQLNQYYALMRDEALKDKEVALFGFFPLGLVIGPQRDYFESVDPCVDYPRFSVEMLLQAIQEKENEGIIPVIVLSQVDRMQRGRSEGTPITSEAKQAVIEYMLTLHDYKIHAETEYYTIYTAEK